MMGSTGSHLAPPSGLSLRPSCLDPAQADSGRPSVWEQSAGCICSPLLCLLSWCLVLRERRERWGRLGLAPLESPPLGSACGAVWFAVLPGWRSTHSFRLGVLPESLSWGLPILMVVGGRDGLQLYPASPSEWNVLEKPRPPGGRGRHLGVLPAGPLPAQCPRLQLILELGCLGPRVGRTSKKAPLAHRARQQQGRRQGRRPPPAPSASALRGAFHAGYFYFPLVPGPRSKEQEGGGERRPAPGSLQELGTDSPGRKGLAGALRALGPDPSVLPALVRPEAEASVEPPQPPAMKAPGSGMPGSPIPGSQSGLPAVCGPEHAGKWLVH